MGTFWKALGKGLIKAAAWCMSHPEMVDAAIDLAKKAKAAKEAK